MRDLQSLVTQGARFIPIHRRIRLPATCDAVALYSGLRSSYSSEGSFLFQRARLTERGYEPDQAILGFDPFETLRSTRGSGDPFRALAEMIRAYPAIRDPELPDFQGGAFGYFGYDSVRHLEPKVGSVPGNLAAGGGMLDAELMLFSKLVVLDLQDGSATVVSGIFPEKESLAEGLARAEREISELSEKVIEVSRQACPFAIESLSNDELPLSEFSASMGEERFTEGVLKLKEHIRAGDIFQAVLSDQFETDCDAEPEALFSVLSRLSPAPYQFLFRSGDRAFLGASPEMLLKVSQGRMETHPIAGTRPRGKTAEEERNFERQLLRSPKENSEHLMLVDLARNDLGRVARTGSVEVTSFNEIRKFGEVMHLVSKVEADLEAGRDSVEALAACFPAGTLSGAPKIRAMQLLSGLESAPRGFYGGAVVAASFTGDLDSCISIRSIELSRGRVRIQAGAGIVADSRPEAEYREIEHKTRSARRALAMVRLLSRSSSGGKAPR